MNNAIHGFDGLATAIATRPTLTAPAPVSRPRGVNPRIAAGLSPEEWRKKRAVERRHEWEARAEQHDVAKAPTRDRATTVAATVERNVELERLREGSCLDPNVPLRFIPPTFRIERGMNAQNYYHAKAMRLGTLGQHDALNPYLNEARQWAKEHRDETH
jgi:hypothetical protein